VEDRTTERMRDVLIEVNRIQIRIDERVGQRGNDRQMIRLSGMEIVIDLWVF